MKSEDKKEVLYCIKNRINIPEPLYDVHALLECYDMGIYAKMCCNRMADTEKIDQEHVYIDLVSPGHILFDRYGISECEDILQSYINEDEFMELVKYVRVMSEHTAAKNEIINLYRSCSKDLLLKWEKDEKHTNSDKYQFVKAELTSRTAYWKLYLSIKKWIDKKKILIKYYDTIQIIKKTAKKIEQSGEATQEGKAVIPEKNGIISEKNAIYSAAYQRFIQKNQVDTIKIWPEDKIKQYVFLGIKAYGVEYARRKKRPGIQGITTRYVELSAIMQSIGMITPKQLQQMFPISKEYDGDKYDMKDYYYTLHALEKAGMDKPIGTEMEAAHLLWDYQNTEISFFLMAYMRCIEDMHIYEIDDRPFKEFYGKEV